ncbi:unnamed protein product [Hydatigera taeniaeformis]|uniref:B30.2/SPRY domain-containing protein n=1 Tax=Hydatigena taeniaeformis TaxID=6205 RepID=A0A0R3X9G5_HYDTA|nr:unnamed protein product [Hydatigera taeniaeformis]
MANSNRSKVPPDSASNLAQLYRSVYTSEPMQHLPLSWNSKDRLLNIKISQFGLTLTCTADTSTSRHSMHCNALAYVHNISSAFFQLLSSLVRFSVFIGWDSSSFGYHSDGSLYHHTTATPFGPKFCEQDVIGCGVDLMSKSLFYTRNGEFLGKAFEGKLPVSGGCRVTSNFGDQSFFYPFKRHIAKDKDFMDVKMRE